MDIEAGVTAAEIERAKGAERERGAAAAQKISTHGPHGPKQPKPRGIRSMTAQEFHELIVKCLGPEVKPEVKSGSSAEGSGSSSKSKAVEPQVSTSSSSSSGALPATVPTSGPDPASSSTGLVPLDISELQHHFEDLHVAESLATAAALAAGADEGHELGLPKPADDPSGVAELDPTIDEAQARRT